MPQQPFAPETGSNDDTPIRGRSSRFLWVITFATAVAIEQLTDSVTLAAIMPCAHAGWKTLRCAFWLKISDPVASRGQACFLFYMSTACWKAAAAAVATAALCMVAAELTGQKPPEDFLYILGVILAGGGCLTALFGIFAVVSAFRGKVRVWVSASVYDICRGDFNLIANLYLSYQQLNQALIVLVVSVFLPVLGAGTGVLIYGTANGAAANAISTVPQIVGFSLMSVGTLAMAPVYGYLSSRIIAHTPAECWSPPLQ